MSFVLVDKLHPHVSLITLNRPERMNAMAFDVMIPLRQAIDDGGGLCLASCCDVRVAADSASFRAAGINNGLTATELGLSFTLPRAIGSSRAMELMLTGRDMDAAEAERIGFVSAVTDADGLLPRCYEIADRIVGMSRVGVELTKGMAWAGLEANSFHTHMNQEMNAQLFVRMTTQNFEEAIRARREERPPNFTDGL